MDKVLPSSGESMIEVNGMAHVILTVGQWDKARAFYGELLPFLGLTKVYDGNNFLYHVGGRTAVGIQRPAK
jgi:catechol 2,3-dioxygenase-like lactoylglutathione lyase family enzyme